MHAATTERRRFLKSWQWLVVCMFFASVADADFIPALFGRLDLANRFHRHLTHTLLFAVILSAVAFGVLKLLRTPHGGRRTMIVFSCMASHILLDLLGKDFRPPLGIPFLWPFTQRSFKIPVEIFIDLHKDTYAEIFSLRTIGILAHETLLFGAIFVLVLGLKLLRSEKERAKAKPETILSGTHEKTA